MTELVDRLAGLTFLGTAPREELAWLAAHGTLRDFAEGDLLALRNVRLEGMFILLEGRTALFIDYGAGRRKVTEDSAGQFLGVLPYSRAVNSPGDLVALEPTTVLVILRDDVPEIIRDCPHLTAMLVHKMLDRARLGIAGGLQDERLASLGRLSAGLAHQLNNPVSAIARNAALLEDRLEDATTSQDNSPKPP